MHSCHQIPTAFELLIENFFPLIENISKCTFPRLFPGCFPGALFFSFSLFKIPKSIAKKVFFPKPAPFMPGVSWVFPGCFPGVSRVFPGCFLGVSWVFPGCFPGVPRHNFLYLSFTLLKIPTAFAKLATLIQNISKCTFPWCFPGISWVFPGCFPGVPEHFFLHTLAFAKNNPHNFC